MKFWSKFLLAKFANSFIALHTGIWYYLLLINLEVMYCLRYVGIIQESQVSLIIFVVFYKNNSFKLLLV